MRRGSSPRVVDRTDLVLDMDFHGLVHTKDEEEPRVEEEAVGEDGVVAVAVAVAETFGRLVDGASPRSRAPPLLEPGCCVELLDHACHHLHQPPCGVAEDDPKTTLAGGVATLGEVFYLLDRSVGFPSDEK